MRSPRCTGSAVDAQSRNAILTGVERLSTEGMGVLCTTHYMEEAVSARRTSSYLEDVRPQAFGLPSLTARGTQTVRWFRWHDASTWRGAEIDSRR